MPVLLRFWAGARRAAGRPEEKAQAATLAELRAMLTARPELAAVLPACSFLLDGRRASEDAPLPDGAIVDVLPPFAGG